MPFNYVLSKEFDPGSLTASQKAKRFTLKAPSARGRKLSTSSTGSTESTKSMSALSEESDDDDSNKLSFDFVPYLKTRAKDFLNNYAKHSHGIMSKEVLKKFYEDGKFENYELNKAANNLITEIIENTNVKGNDSEKEEKIRDELIKLIKERYNTNLNEKHRIKSFFVKKLEGGKRKTSKKQRKTKKSKRATKKH
jgi:hypothetical protein